MGVNTKRYGNNDVSEERSVFIKGISKVATEEEVKDKLKNFGDIKNVKFCIDKETGFFKCTGFAEFKTKEAASTCIQNSQDPAFKQEFTIDGLAMKCMQALSKNNLMQAESGTKKRYNDKDKRNIYLAREGVIRSGTKAAEGVSRFDLAARVQREKAKHKLLTNLHCFVSPTRLFFCNIPEDILDNDLKNIFKEYAPQEAVIDECRIMKNLDEVVDGERPKSKGFGFINFSVHAHALATLRAVNNNPKIFTSNMRPIVEFSIENMAALNAKLKRQEKSKGTVEKSETELSFSGSQVKHDPTYNNSSFVGGKAKKGMKLATHFGSKVKTGKITRNQINNRARKQRKQQKSRIVKQKNQQKILSAGGKKKRQTNKNKFGKKKIQKNKPKK